MADAFYFVLFGPDSSDIFIFLRELVLSLYFVLDLRTVFNFVKHHLVEVYNVLPLWKRILIGFELFIPGADGGNKGTSFGEVLL